MAAKKKKEKTSEDPQNALIARNKKARFKYELFDHFEAGIVLTGSEIKSVRKRQVSLDQAFGRERGGEIYLLGVNIAPYEQAGYANHEPLRPRKILLHRREIAHIIGVLAQGGATLVPVSMYLKRGIAKVEVALARGKRQYDKREDLKKRDAEREIKRAVTRRR